MPVPGSLRRITLTDFMQYDAVSFTPGPHLNVILGPNGSGKSSIVNAITIGLAGKTGSLGRATHLAEFIRTGRNEAAIEIELFRDEEDGERCWVIERRFGQDGKSQWRLDGKISTQKTVEKLTKELNIQTENLCQFLPQDKVHEFSRMNPRELLGKTIEAVGETQLKEDHETLKKLQEDLGKNEEQHEARLQMLNENRRKCDKLEEQAKNFREREALQNKISLLEKRRDWALVLEQKEECMRVNKRMTKIAKELSVEENKTAPVREKLKNLNKSKDTTTQKSREIVSSIRECVNQAKKKSQRIESIEEDLDALDAERDRLASDEGQRLQKIKTFEDEIAHMESEMTQEIDPRLDANIQKVMESISEVQERKFGVTTSMEEGNMERKAIESKIRTLMSQIEELENVDAQKLSALRKMKQGEDTHRALQWLNENRNMFRGRIYDPIMLNINMLDPRDAVFVENCVGVKDLVAFGAESADDVNLLISQLRERMKLNVNIAQVDPNANPDSFKPSISPESYRGLDYRGVLKDLLQAPDPIKVLLCKLYKIHEIPVFGNMTDKVLEQFVQKFKLKVFFINDTRYSCTVSRYGGHVSTSSNKIFPRHWLHFSTDHTHLNQLHSKIEEHKERNQLLLQQYRQMSNSQKSLDKDIEVKTAELRQLKQQKDHKRMLETRLESRRNQMKAFLTTDGNVGRERRMIALRRAELGKEVLDTADQLKKVILEGTNLNIRNRLLKMKVRLETGEQDLLARDLEESDQVLEEINSRLKSAKKDMSEAEQELIARKINAKAGMEEGFVGDKAPKSLTEKFAAAELPADSATCDVQLEDLRTSLECLEDVDHDVIREYNRLKRAIQELEAEVDRYERRVDERREGIDKIRERWLTRLKELVDKIGARFSHYFASMGFAGDVVLNTGSHDNDFHHFGIDILVKYRGNEPLQRLNPHQQSGGERSVATALYMMALQELTVVPFRCVDEINQGMDAANERRVFDLLVRISCTEQSAQYFLLTPKLLPNLNYDRNMNVLVVNNGVGMCDYKRWDVSRFVEAARNASA